MLTMAADFPAGKSLLFFGLLLAQVWGEMENSTRLHVYGRKDYEESTRKPGMDMIRCYPLWRVKVHLEL